MVLERIDFHQTWGHHGGPTAAVSKDLAKTEQPFRKISRHGLVGKNSALTAHPTTTMTKTTTILLALALLLPLPAAAELPATLADTGLWSDPETRTLAPGVVAYEPRHPLWTDGLDKQRWIQIPAGTAIVATDPDHLRFPIGTKLWKQFAFEGAPVETRYLERTESGWLFAAYVWQGDEAVLAPQRGLRTQVEVAPGQMHDIPGRYDCAACHGGQDPPVLGFSAVQLSVTPDPSDLDLAALTDAGLVVGLPAELLERPVHDTPAAVGYLHGNCGHCHNAGGPLAGLGLDLQLRVADAGQTPAAVATTVDVEAHTTARSARGRLRVDRNNPFESQLLQRVNNRDPLARMPPLGTKIVDPRGVELLTTWIRDELAATDPHF